MPRAFRGSEQQFRAIVRELIESHTYPRHREIVLRLRRSSERWPFGLSVAQGRWRREEVESAGYDWELSRAARTLIRREAGPAQHTRTAVRR